MWRKNWRKKGEKGEESDGKMGNTHLLEAWKTILNYDENGRKRARRRGK
jgi:hypothetical protein